jgi:hypothetical protein
MLPTWQWQGASSGSTPGGHASRRLGKSCTGRASSASTIALTVCFGMRSVTPSSFRSIRLHHGPVHFGQYGLAAMLSMASLDSR